MGPDEYERLAMLAEEASEIIHACTKIMRHGYESCNPLDSSSPTNRGHLIKEIRDLEAVVQLMRDKDDFWGIQADSVDYVLRKKLKYTHYQGNDYD